LNESEVGGRKKVPLKKKVKAKYPKPFPFAHLVS
jgi:hypothetical protein